MSNTHVMTSFPRALHQPVALGALIDRVKSPAELRGDTTVSITAVAPLNRAVQGCFAFCRHESERGIEAIGNCNASVIVISPQMDVQPKPGQCLIRVSDPRGWFIDALRVLFPETATAGIDATARVGKTASVASNVRIGPYCVVEDGAVIGAECQIGAGTYVGSAVTLGKNVRVQTHTTLGGEGLSFHQRPDGSEVTFPHLGRLLIGDDVWVGSQSSLMRGILDDTLVGSGSVIGNNVNIGHNCRLGSGCFLSSGTVLTGGAVIGDLARLAAGVFVASHIEIGSGAWIGIGTVIYKHVAPNARLFGNPPRSIPGMRRF